MTDPNECPICYQPMRNPAVCPAASCRYKTCRNCLRRYVLETLTPAHCIQCKRPYDWEELVNATCKTFVASTYKDHRKSMLLSMERSLLPEAQEVLEKIWGSNDGATLGELKAEEKQLEETTQGLRNQIFELSKQLSEKNDRLISVRLGIARRDHTVAVATMEAAKDWSKGRVRQPGAAGKEDRRVFVWKCPAPNCRGFLSQKWKCGLCGAHVCNQCGEIKKEGEEGQHACVASEVESMSFLKATTRNCPHCGVAIFRIDGCAQMWCTNCRGAFSWVSGEKLDVSKLHNPHYAEWKARHAGARVLEDDDCVGMGVPPLHISERTMQILTPELVKYATDFRDRLLHHEDITTVSLGVPIEDKRKMLRLRYLNQEITEEAWMRELMKLTKRAEYRERALQIVNMLVNVGSDLLRNFAAQAVRDDLSWRAVAELLKKTVDEMRGLVAYVDDQYAKIARAYGYKAAFSVGMPESETKTLADADTKNLANDAGR